jgi:uncharacterized membrane protein HdeD (DUF308 family)
MFAKTLSRFWWMLLLRGIVSILFGCFALANPGMTLAYLVLFFGAYVIVQGVFNVIQAFSSWADQENGWPMLLLGLLSIVVGVLTLRSPGITALVLLFYLAIFALLTGVLEMVLAIRLRKEIQGEFWLFLAGLLSVLFGVLLIARPGAGALGVILYIGIWAIVIGVFTVILAFRVRGFAKGVQAAVGGASRTG